MAKIDRKKLTCGTVVMIRWDDAPDEKVMVISREGSELNVIPMVRPKKRTSFSFMPNTDEVSVSQVVKIVGRVPGFVGY